MHPHTATGNPRHLRLYTIEVPFYVLAKTGVFNLSRRPAIVNSWSSLEPIREPEARLRIIRNMIAGARSLIIAFFLIALLLIGAPIADSHPIPSWNGVLRDDAGNPVPDARV